MLYFKHFAPAEMYTVVGEHVFPFFRERGGDGSTDSQHMKDARFWVTNVQSDAFRITVGS